MEMMELRKYNLELEERVAGLSRRAESQQAEIDEATYYIYDHGAIKTELEQLRRTKITNLVEINRLTSENVKQGMELCHAEESLRVMQQNQKKTNQIHQPDHRMEPVPDRATATQTRINHLWQGTSVGYRSGSRSQQANLSIVTPNN